jgi:hypothetical protein
MRNPYAVFVRNFYQVILYVSILILAVLSFVYAGMLYDAAPIIAITQWQEVISNWSGNGNMTHFWQPYTVYQKVMPVSVWLLCFAGVIGFAIIATQIFCAVTNQDC